MGRGPGGVADAAVLIRPLSPDCSQGTPPASNDAQGGAPKHAPGGNVSPSALALAYRRTTPRIFRLLTRRLRLYQATDASRPQIGYSALVQADSGRFSCAPAT